MNSQYQSQLFSMYKFEKANIILMNNLTRKLYAYSDIEREINYQNYHHIILKAQPLCSGLVYEKQLTSLRKQVQPRIQARYKDYFGEEQLNNTFEPILDFLLLGIEHEGISLDSILVDNEGKIRLKDPRLTKLSSQNDWETVGFLMVQCALLINDQKLARIQKTKASLINSLENYSTEFVAKIWILLNNAKKFLRQLNLGSNIERSRQYKQLIDQLDNLKEKKQDRKQNIQKQRHPNDKKQNPLQIKFNKTKKIQIIKLQSSIKKKTPSNQNQNQKQQKNKDKEALQKLFNQKISLNKDNQKDQIGNTKIKKLNLLQIQPAQLIIRAKKSQKQLPQSNR